MKKKMIAILTVFILVILVGCTQIPESEVFQAESDTEQSQVENAVSDKVGETVPAETENGNKIMEVRSGDIVIQFQLNDSIAATQLYDMLPMTVDVDNYDTMEKIFFPPKLDVSDARLADGGGVGDLTYYASWGNVVMYYDDYPPYKGLYDMGYAISGSAYIKDLTGTVEITKGSSGSVEDMQQTEIDTQDTDTV